MKKTLQLLVSEEWRCFSYIVVPMLAWTKTYYVVSWPLSFRLWLPCMLLAGFIYRMDVWAQGLALAKAWRSHDYLGRNREGVGRAFPVSQTLPEYGRGESSVAC